MKTFRRVKICVLAVLVCTLPAGAQELPFEEVVRNLSHQDPEVRMSALRVLRDAKYPEAIVPLAALITDPENDIQVEAISAELSFFLVKPVPGRKRVAFLIERRAPGSAEAVFEKGPLAVWPSPVPQELVDALLAAIDDDHRRVRSEAVYALGALNPAPLADGSAKRLIDALIHEDPVIRAAAAKVIGRLRLAAAVDALLKSVNDPEAEVRYASMRALGELRAEAAVETLTAQYRYYGKGEGAAAALQALALIAHPSSVPLFKERLGDQDPLLRRAAAEGLGRTGDTSEVSALRIGAGNDFSEPVRAAMCFALEKLGHNYVTRLVDFMDSAEMASQIQGYLLELGPSIAPRLHPRLLEPDPAVRTHVVQLLGAFGRQEAIPVLEPMLQDRDPEVIEAATHALQRIKMTSSR